VLRFNRQPAAGGFRVDTERPVGPVDTDRDEVGLGEQLGVQRDCGIQGAGVWCQQEVAPPEVRRAWRRDDSQPVVLGDR
jgi:hypothetical protein